MAKRFISLLLLSASLTLTACSNTPSAAGISRASGVAQARKAPAHRALGFADLNDGLVNLGDFAGQPIVLVFMDPKNHDSQAEVPQLIRLAGAYQAEGVAFVMVGERASKAELKAFAESQDLPFPLWQDPSGAEMASRRFTEVPAHQFIDKLGKVVSSKQGYLSRGEFLERIDQILK